MKSDNTEHSAEDHLEKPKASCCQIMSFSYKKIFFLIPPTLMNALQVETNCFSMD